MRWNLIFEPHTRLNINLTREERKKERKNITHLLSVRLVLWWHEINQIENGYLISAGNLSPV